MSTYFNKLALRAQPDTPVPKLQPIAADIGSMNIYDPFSAASDEIETIPQPAPPPVAKQPDQAREPEHEPAAASPGRLSPSKKEEPMQPGYSYLQQHFFREVMEKDSTTVIPNVPQQEQTVILQTNQFVKKSQPERHTPFPTKKKDESNSVKEILWLKSGDVERPSSPLPKADKKPASFLAPATPVAPLPATPPVGTATKSLSIGTITIEIVPSEKTQIVHTVENRIIQTEPAAQNSVDSMQLFGLAQI